MTNFLNTTTRSVIWMKEAHEKGILMMKPPFQRNPVWTSKQQGYLIDTILSGFPVPEIYMQEIVTATGAQQHIVVDGQQRIQSCLEFLEGKFSLDPEDSPARADCSFEDLSADDKKALFAYNFVVRMLPDVGDDVLREIFRRLNRNVVALNKQELRHATYWGAFIKSVESLAENEFWVLSNLFSANDFRRMLDIEYISELAVCYLHGPQNKKTRLDEFYALYENEFDREEDVRAATIATICEIKQVLPDMKASRWRKKSDFYSLFAHLAAYCELFPLAGDLRDKLAEFLNGFSEHVRVFLQSLKVEEVEFNEEEGTLSFSAPEAEVAKIGVPKPVSEYALAVQRAASDLGNRRIRAAALNEYMEPFWKVAGAKARPPTGSAPGKGATGGGAIAESKVASRPARSAPAAPEARRGSEK